MDASLIAYTRQRSLFDRLNIVSNNVANANTTGFKADLATYMNPQGTINGEPNPIPAMRIAVDTSQAGLRQTGRSFDVAISGNGYFQVESPLGTRYTRNGAFFTDTDGNLVTKEGYPVVGDGGPIILQPTDYDIEIGENGQILARTPDNTLEPRGAIGVFKFEDPSSLTKVGETYFTSDSDAVVADVRTDYKVSQGMLEESNVNTVQQMTEMVEISRGVQSVANIIQDQHTLLRNTVQRIAGVN